MTIGNKPENGALAVKGRVYWWLSIGRRAMPQMYFDHGWRAFTFVILKPYNPETPQGQGHKVLFELSFAFWLPFYKL